MFFRILANEHVKICKRSVLWISAGVLAALLLVQTVCDCPEAGGAAGGTPEFVSPEMQERIHQAALETATWPTAPARALESVEQSAWLALIAETGTGGPL